MAAPSQMASQVTNDTTAANIRPSSRSSATCVTCRARKVRCDGRRGVCNNCHRLGFSCSYNDDSGVGGHARLANGSSSATHNLPKRRVRQACLSCHARKARCSGTTPRCDRCEAQGIACVYRPGRRPRGVGSGDVTASGRLGQSEEPHSDHSRSLSSDRASVPSPRLPGRDRPCLLEGMLEPLALRTFDSFFRHVHHVPVFSFLHRASLMQRYHAGHVDRPLLLALVGITALLTDPGGSTVELGVRCILEAEALLLRELDRPSTLRLQALVLIVKHHILSRRFSSAFMLHSIACRFASVLRLNHENPKLCFLARESRRRLMWSLYMIDTAMARGNVDLGLWVYREDSVRIQLPCNERNFEYDLPETTEPLQPVPGPTGVLPPLADDVGFLALHIRIHLIRSRILRYTRQVLHGPTADELAAMPGQFSQLTGELNAFADRLPASFRWSESNVRLRTYSPRLCVFFMTHVLWEQCHCDLYRVVLPDLPEAFPSCVLEQLARQHVTFLHHCRKQAFEHTRAMADMFSLLLTLDNGIPVTDLDLPACLYQCSRMLQSALGAGPDVSGMTTATVAELSSICLRVLKQCVTTPASLGIQRDLETLIANGLPTASIPGGPDVSVADLLPPVLSPHASEQESSEMAGANAVPTPVSPIGEAAGPPAISLYQEVDTPIPRRVDLGTFIDVPPVARALDPERSGTPSGVEGGIEGVASGLHSSNAFDGEMDELGIAAGSLGVDSWSWSFSEWLDDGFQVAEVSTW